MAFRKRNIALTRLPTGDEAQETPTSLVTAPGQAAPGVRPSPIDGRPTTSTGTPSLDGILAGHAGLPLGTSVLIEESGTTDYAGALLRFYAAEGVVQGHRVHLVGMSDVWGRELPGIAEDRDDRRKEGRERVEKMKIAWRYEGLGQFESGRGALYINSMQHMSKMESKIGLQARPLSARVHRSSMAQAQIKRLSFVTHSTWRDGSPLPSERPSTIYLYPAQVHRPSRRFSRICRGSLPRRQPIQSIDS